VTIFSQYGEPVNVNLVRDKDTGKSKGFAFLKYEDQRSTDLAVDNLGGATVMGRVLRVDHTRYKRRDEEAEEDNVATIMGETAGRPRDGDFDTDTERRQRRSRGKDRDADDSDLEEKPRPLLKEEKELAELMRDHDEEDPMKEYLIQEKKGEVARALQSLKSSEKRKSSRRHDSRERSHRHRHHHRRRGSDEAPRSRERSHRDRDDADYRKRTYRDRLESPNRRRERRRERD
jgi:RNA-binding motif protein, X-linked 2